MTQIANLPKLMTLTWNISNPLTMRAVNAVTAELLESGVIPKDTRTEFTRYAVCVFLRNYAMFRRRMVEEGKDPVEELRKIADAGNDVNIEDILLERIDLEIGEVRHAKEGEEGKEEQDREE